MAETKRRKKYFQACAGQLGEASWKDRGPTPCKVFVANISYQVSGLHLPMGRPILELFDRFSATLKTGVRERLEGIFFWFWPCEVLSDYKRPPQTMFQRVCTCTCIVNSAQNLQQFIPSQHSIYLSTCIVLMHILCTDTCEYEHLQYWVCDLQEYRGCGESLVSSRGSACHGWKVGCPHWDVA